MPRGTPFHERTSALCESYAWRNWSGYMCASSYQLVPEMEYHAIRSAAGLIDVSPLFKYHVAGRDAARLVNKVITRDASKCKPGQILYTPWCDDAGMTVDDGTAWNLGDGSWDMTSAESNLRWLEENATGLDATVEDDSERIAALALQGPLSRAILQHAADGAVDKLRFYRFTNGKIDGLPVRISRTGYTGDLGYEVWVTADRALELWDALMEHGAGYGITPAGLLALDIARLEAGFILAEVDYTPARRALTEAQRYSPFELSLDWTVDMAKGPFTGRRALAAELRRGVRRRIVGLEVDWSVAERYYEELRMPPDPPRLTWRSKIPLYVGLQQIGIATSGVWSPLLKKYVALATVDAAYAKPGSTMDIEVTVEGERRRAPARVVPRPFYDPPRKKA